jgi:hypothetical protein
VWRGRLVLEQVAEETSAETLSTYMVGFIVEVCASTVASSRSYWVLALENNIHLTRQCQRGRLDRPAPATTSCFAACGQPLDWPVPRRLGSVGLRRRGWVTACAAVPSSASLYRIIDSLQTSRAR